MKFFKNVICTLGCIGLYFNAHAQVPPALVTLLNNTLDSMRTVVNIKSLSGGIQFTDSLSWAHATGISSENPTVEVVPEDAYLIGSVTKTMTSACILQLVDEQVLDLNDSLYEWVDSFPFVNPNITIKQLLRHQSGLFDVLGHPHCFDSLYADPGRIWTAKELLDRFLQAPLFAAGSNWSYSNTNYFLLGMIIEKATGHPFYEELRSRFFEPLGLNTMAIPSFEPLNSPVAHVWIDLNGDNVTDDANDFYMNFMALNSTAGAAGGYFGTAADLSKWMRTYMRGDLLSAAMMAAAKTTVTAPGLPATTYGLGLMKKNFIGYDGYGHGGDLSYCASSWYFPAKGISISVLGNDSKKDSWKLVPVVAALLKTWNTWNAVSETAQPLDETADVAMSASPNPFEKEMVITLHLPSPVPAATLVVTNAVGITVKAMEQRDLHQGDNFIVLNDLENLPHGVYFATAMVQGKALTTIRILK